MAEWKKYTGAPEQIEEIINSDKKILVDSRFSIFREPLRPCLHRDAMVNIEWLKTHFEQNEVKFYLLGEPHPYADMICQWAKTCQPVYLKDKINGETGLCNQRKAFMWPELYEYSFTPFDG